MVNIERSGKFKRNFKKLKEGVIKKRIKKQIIKIVDNPEIGEFLRGDKKGIRKIYIPTFRLLYRYHRDKNLIELLDFDKKDKIYKK